MSDSPHCVVCGDLTVPCFGTTETREEMHVRAWYCPSCGWSTSSVGREKLITLEDWDHE